MAICKLILWLTVVSCLISTWLINPASGKTKTVRKRRWFHKETPEQLRKKVLDFRKELDKWGGLSEGGDCSSFNSQANYTVLNDYLDAGNWKEARFFNSGFKDDPRYDKDDVAKYKKLQEELAALKAQGSPATAKKILCPMTKGLVCDKVSKKCRCKKDQEEFLPEPKNDIKSEFKNGKCVLLEKSACLIKDSGWMSCEKHPNRKLSAYDLHCIIKPGVKVPVPRDPCTPLNREKWDLTAESLCSCELSPDGKKLYLKHLLESIQKIETIEHGKPCDPDDQAAFKELLKIVTTQGPDQASDFYKLNDEEDKKSNGQFHRVFQGNKDKKPFLCWRNPLPNHRNTQLDCPRKGPNAGKCSCFHAKTTTLDPKRGCIHQPGSRCDRDGNPHPCSPGERCLALDVPGDPVLCDKTLMDEDFKLLQISEWASEVNCICSPRKFRKRFNQQQLDYLVKKNDQEWAKMVETFMDERNATNFKVLEKGGSCEWEVDRAYFHVKDFITAGKGHIAHNLNLLDTMITLAKNKDKSFKNPKWQVCNFTQGMRCIFSNVAKDENKKDVLKGLCGCPTEGWYGETIESEFKDKRCYLKSGSLCHPTLGELPCVQGETCIYLESRDKYGVTVSCDRAKANRQRIIDAGVILNSARCQCQPLHVGKNVPQEFQEFLKEFQRKETIRKKKMEEKRKKKTEL